MKHIKHCSVIAALAAAALTFAGVAPAALAANDGATQDAVVATRSFPKTNAVKKNILAEASSTQVESDSDWGGVESLNVPQNQISSRKMTSKPPQRQRNSSVSSRPRLKHRPKPLLVPPLEATSAAAVPSP